MPQNHLFSYDEPFEEIFLKTEEGAVEIYLSHLSAIVTLSGLSRRDVMTIKKIIRYNIEATRRHREFVQSLIERVEGEAVDVY